MLSIHIPSGVHEALGLSDSVLCTHGREGAAGGSWGTADPRKHKQICGERRSELGDRSALRTSKGEEM